MKVFWYNKLYFLYFENKKKKNEKNMVWLEFEKIKESFKRGE